MACRHNALLLQTELALNVRRGLGHLGCCARPGGGALVFFFLVKGGGVGA